jgi:hypothetical protein
MSIRLYEQMKARYNETKPIRGRSTEVRPWGDRRRDWEQVICRVQSDGQCAYGARMHSTDVMLVLPNGNILFNIDGWHTTTTAAFMGTLLFGFYVNKQYSKLWLQRNVGTENFCAVLDKPTLVIWDTTKPNYEHYRLAEPSTAKQKVIDPIKAKAERAKIKPFKDYATSMLKLSDGRVSTELMAMHIQKSRSFWEGNATLFDTEIGIYQMYRLDFNERTKEIIHAAMRTTDPDAQLELFPKLFVMFARGCDALRSTDEYNEYDPKSIIAKIDKFITKHTDVYKYKEVTITKPIKLA